MSSVDYAPLAITPPGGAVPFTGGVTQPPIATSSILPTNQQLQRNPQLPQSPLGAYTDAQYEAAMASLRAQTQRTYADILQKLGYVDDQGNFIMGSVEDDANRQKADLNRSLGIADENVTKEHQQLGTLFSGVRGTDQARAEYPFTQQIGDIERTTPLTLQQLYEQAAGLMSDYTNQQNSYLADAAARRAAALQNTPPEAGISGTGAAGTPPAPGSTGLPSTPTGTGGGLIPDVGATLGLPQPGAGANLNAARGFISGLPTIAPQPQAYAPPAPTGPVNPAAPNPAQILTATQRKLMQWG